eukprot:5640655-Amphidinium_carterae.1
MQGNQSWNEGEINMRRFRLRRKSAPGLYYGFQPYPTPTTEVQFSESARRQFRQGVNDQSRDDEEM